MQSLKKLFYKIFRLKRYFTVVYEFKTTDGKDYTGRITVITTDGSYMSLREFPKIVKIKNDLDIVFGSVFPLNITELNPSDYRDFQK